MEGRLDSLIDRIYDRFVNRYFRGEKVFVDLQGDKYYAQISKIFPPKTVRDVARAKVYGTTSHGSPLKHEISASLTTPSRPSTASGPSGTFAGGSSAGPIGSPVLGINSVSPSTGAADQEQRLEEELNRLAHKAGTDLDVDPIEAQSRDDPEEYLYTVQLMDENSNFEGSYMEVKIKQIRYAFRFYLVKRPSEARRVAGTGCPFRNQSSSVTSANPSSGTRRSVLHGRSNRLWPSSTTSRPRSRSTRPSATRRSGTTS